MSKQNININVEKNNDEVVLPYKWEFDCGREGQSFIACRVQYNDIAPYDQYDMNDPYNLHDPYDLYDLYGSYDLYDLYEYIALVPKNLIYDAPANYTKFTVPQIKAYLAQKRPQREEYAALLLTALCEQGCADEAARAIAEKLAVIAFFDIEQEYKVIYTQLSSRDEKRARVTAQQIIEQSKKAFAQLVVRQYAKQAEKIYQQSFIEARNSYLLWRFAEYCNGSLSEQKRKMLKKFLRQIDKGKFTGVKNEIEEFLLQCLRQFYGNAELEVGAC